MKFPLFIIVMICINAVSCRLDSNLFNPNDTPITEYTMDDYEGDQDFHLDDSYTIADSLVHLFNVTSDLDGNKAKLYAIYIGDTLQIATDTVILYCHGNKDHMDLYWQRAKLLANVGGKNRLGVLYFDYRGYGLSEDKPSEAGLYADTDAMMQWLKNHGLTSDRLVIYGFSMGTSAATELTANPRTLTPSKLILEAPFASADAIVQGSAVTTIPASFIVNLEIDNAEEIKKVQQPFLWMHGMDDDFVDFETQGQVVAKNYHGVYKVEAPVPGANHSEVPQTMGFAVYSELLRSFIIDGI